MPQPATGPRSAELERIDYQLRKLAALPRTPETERRINVLLDKRLHHQPRTTDR